MVMYLYGDLTLSLRVMVFPAVEVYLDSALPTSGAANGFLRKHQFMTEYALRAPLDQLDRNNVCRFNQRLAYILKNHLYPTRRQTCACQIY